MARKVERLRVFRPCPLIAPEDARSSLQMLRIGNSNALYLTVAGPGTALAALGAATEVDSGLVSDGGPGHKGLSVGSPTGQPERAGRF